MLLKILKYIGFCIIKSAILYLIVILLLPVFGYSFHINIEKEDQFAIGKQVIFNQDIVLELNMIYENSKPVEYVACLKGEITNSSYIITGFYEPKIYARSEDFIVYSECVDSIGTIHSHPTPGSTCQLSSQDIYTFGATQELLTCVQCADNTFGCYTPQNLHKRLPSKII